MPFRYVLIVSCWPQKTVDRLIRRWGSCGQESMFGFVWLVLNWKRGLRLGKMSVINWRRQWQPTPVLLPGKSHGWRSLVGYSPCGHEESDTTERLHFQFSFSCIGEGNGNPLQYSCLENPRDRGAWWAAVYGATQSQT